LSSKPALFIFILPVIVIVLPLPSKDNVAPSSKVWAELNTIVPPPVALPPLDTVGKATVGSIPIPLTVFPFIIPVLEVTVTFVLLLTAPLTVVEVLDFSIFKLENSTS